MTLHIYRVSAVAMTLSILCAGSVAASTAAENLSTINAGAIRAHLEFLASDLLEGRDAGTRGYDLAVPCRRTSSPGNNFSRAQITTRSFAAASRGFFSLRAMLRRRTARTFARSTNAGRNSTCISRRTISTSRSIMGTWCSGPNCSAAGRSARRMPASVHSGTQTITSVSALRPMPAKSIDNDDRHRSVFPRSA